MKNTMKCFGIIALVAVIGFSMISCDDGTGGLFGGPGGNPNNPPNNPISGTEASPLSLAAGSWANNSVTSTASAVWYSFSVTSGSTYYIWWNDDYEGDNAKTGDVKVSASYSGGTSIFTGVDNGWSSPSSFTASTSGTVKIKVEPYSNSSNYYGTFAIVFSTSNTRPGTGGGNPPNNPGGIAVTGVSFNRGGPLSTTVNAQITLTADVAPSNATNKSVTWSSSSPSVASVSNGVITGVATGVATITVTTADGGKTASITVIVTGSGGGQTFTSISAFDTWLTGQPTNTAHDVKINISDLGGSVSASGSLGYVLAKSANANKYVNIDLSGSTITSIPASAFANFNSTLAGVTIGSSVTSIGEYAFSSCSNLASVAINGSVTSFGQGAFSECPNLASVTIGNNVTRIGTSAFVACRNLTSVTIGNSVTMIGYYAFQYCSSLTSVTIPNSVTEIGISAFAGCSSLTSVTIPDSVKDIDSNAFENCTKLASVTLGNGIVTISAEAFKNCTNLTSVTFLKNNILTTWWSSSSFAGDLRAKYFATTGGGAGKYTRSGSGTTQSPYVWTKS